MNYKLTIFFILFCMNNLLHQISEKIVIILFLLFVFVLGYFIKKILNLLFEQHICGILNDINMYMNSLLNFLYINKVIYVNLKKLVCSYKILFSYFEKRIFRIFLLST